MSVSLKFGVRVCTVLLCGLMFVTAGLAQAGERLALVIGNANYANETLNLKNPLNDANGLAAGLAELGFEVTKAIDQDRITLDQTLGQFEQDMKGAEIALLFFAGHGVQLGGENHLLTAGFSKLDLAEVAHEAVTLSDIRRRFARANPDLGVIILDACRNNPFTDSGQISRGLSRSQGSSGVLIAYATDPGNVAFDGFGDNSVFTQALIDNIAAPGLETRLMLGRVRQQVAMATSGLQVPWVEESVLGEFYFNPSDESTSSEALVSAEVEAWRRANITNSTASFQAYLDEFPDGLFRQFAQDRVNSRRISTEQRLASVEDIGRILETADPVRTTAALSALGFLPPMRGTVPETAELERALSAYAGQVSVEGELEIDRLYLDAAQVVVVLGAATAQHIRTDIAALSSIDKTLIVAEDAYAQLEVLAESNPAAKEFLPTAALDLTEINRARNQVLSRLDQSRSYYAELLDTGESNFAPYLSRSLVGLRDQSRSVSAFEQSVIKDADNFIRHAEESASEATRGSYGWLAEFIPTN